MKRECTYCLTDDGVFDSIDAAGKHSEGQSRVETEVEKHVPSFPTDADCAAEKQNNTRMEKSADTHHTPHCFVLYDTLKSGEPKNAAHGVKFGPIT